MAKKSKSPNETLILSDDLDANEAFEQAHVLLAEETEADNVKAIAFFRVAAAQGHAAAQNDLATMLRDGVGCTPDIREAIDWYQFSAKNGESSALYNLGLIHLHGIGIEANKSLAAEYLLEAANAGDAAAMCDLGTMLSQGDGVDQDPVVAAWLHLGAAEDGYAEAAVALARYSRELEEPALHGNVHAARALHRIYRDGIGHQADPAHAWAWIRWAHDVCQPLAGTDEDADAVLKDYKHAIDSIDDAARAAGDNHFQALLAANSSRKPVR
jgi:TPR repeat protein